MKLTQLKTLTQDPLSGVQTFLLENFLLLLVLSTVILRATLKLKKEEKNHSLLPLTWHNCTTCMTLSNSCWVFSVHTSASGWVSVSLASKDHSVTLTDYSVRIPKQRCALGCMRWSCGLHLVPGFQALLF